MRRLLSIIFTSTIHSLVLGCGSTTSDVQESLTNLSQDRVLDAWRYKSHTTTINYNLSPHQLKKITHITRIPMFIIIQASLHSLLRHMFNNLNL